MTSINFDKTKTMIFGTRQDQRFYFNLGGHKLDIYTDFKYLGVTFSRNRHFNQTKNNNIMLSKLGRQCLYFLNEIGLELAIDPLPPGGILYTKNF